MRTRLLFAVIGASALATVACKSEGTGGSGGGHGGKGGTGGTASTAPPSWDRMVTPPSDADATTQRAVCGYMAGSLPAETQGASHPSGKDIPIDHILVLMQENRSFDHYFQTLPQNGQPDVEVAPPTYTNPDVNGLPVAPYHNTTYCFVDTDHEWAGSHVEYDDGKMDGFILANENSGTPPPHPLPDSMSGVRALGYYDNTDIPFYFWLANEYSIADHYFCSLLGPTWPNRQYLYAASSRGETQSTLPSFYDQKNACKTDADCGGTAGDCAVNGHACVVDMDIGCGCKASCQKDDDCGRDSPVGTCDVASGGVCKRVGRTLFDYMEQRGLDWKVYASGTPGFGVTVDAFINYGSKHMVPFDQFFTDAAAGTLPQVAFLDPHLGNEKYDQDDEHPPATPFVGQLFVAKVVDALGKSPNWPSSALFFTYDEHGGLFDHMPPPKACPPGDLPTKISPGDPPGDFDRYGVRVPMMVVSPFAKKHFVSHEVYDHTSITRFIEDRFVLPAISNRDANAEAPWDMFDFTNPPHASAPAVTLPDVDQAKLDACKSVWVQ
jgi:phospholipase C